MPRTTVQQLHEWNPLEPSPPPVPPVEPGVLCAPYSAAGSRIGAWVPITVCPSRCHLVAHWPARVLTGEPFAALVLWDGGARWCAMPMVGSPPQERLDEDVTIPLAPLYPPALED